MATSTLTPPVTLTTPYSATLSYVLQHTPTNVSETTVIQPSVADTIVDQANPAQNYGSGLTMDVQRGSVRRSLVRFDFSLIPSGATITAATLELYATAVPGTSRNLAVHRITAAWVEGSATWTSFAGAFETAAAATIAGGTSTGWKTWTVTSLVRALFEGTYANHGFLVKASSETGSGTYSFATRENATTGNRPILRVTYTIPGPTTRSQVALVGPTSAVTVPGRQIALTFHSASVTPS